MTDFTCPQCDTPFQRDGIDMNSGVMKCGVCGTSMGLTLERTAHDAPIVRVAPAEQPPSVQQDITGEGLALTCKWGGSLLPVLVVMLALLESPILFFMLRRGAPKDDPFIDQLIVSCVLIGLAAAYAAVAQRINHTRLEITGGELWVRHGPLPWPGGRRLSTVRLRQVFCQRPKRREAVNPRIPCQIWAEFDDGSRLKLVHRLDLDQAVYVEQELEKRLSLRDRPVS